MDKATHNNDMLNGAINPKRSADAPVDGSSITHKYPRTDLGDPLGGTCSRESPRHVAMGFRIAPLRSFLTIHKGVFHSSLMPVNMPNFITKYFLTPVECCW